MAKSDSLTFISVTFLFLPFPSSFSVSDSSDPKNFCPSGWEFIKASEKCVFVNRSSRGSFDAAEKFCQELNSSMLVLNSSEEASTMDGMMRNSLSLRFWAKYEVHVGEWPSLEWKPRNPNNHSKWSHEESDCSPASRCCSLFTSRSKRVFVDCNTKAVMVCQMEQPTKRKDSTNVPVSEGEKKSSCFNETTSFSLGQFLTTLSIMKKRIETKLLKRIQNCQQDQLEIIGVLDNLIDQLRNCLQRSNETQSEHLEITSNQFGAVHGHEPIAYSIFAAVVLAILISLAIVLCITSRVYKRRSSNDKNQNKLLLSSSQWASRCSDAAFD